jgi:hypothetical protein
MSELLSQGYSRARRWITLAAGAAACAAAAVIYRVKPEADSLYPRCPFHALTGLHCPGCGTLRCLHALLHGDVPQALAYNILAVLALPFLIAWACRVEVAAVRGRPWVGKPLPTWVVRAILVLVVAYWVLRNLPFFPFRLLAPHAL